MSGPVITLGSVLILLFWLVSGVALVTLFDWFWDRRKRRRF